MKFPSYERQNRWISDYIAPIIIDLDIGKVIQNYKRNKREALRNDMAEAGVFESLERLENDGTHCDRIMSQMREGIENAEHAKMVQTCYEQIDFGKYFGTLKPVPLERNSLFPVELGYVSDISNESHP